MFIINPWKLIYLYVTINHWREFTVVHDKLGCFYYTTVLIIFTDYFFLNLMSIEIYNISFVKIISFVCLPLTDCCEICSQLHLSSYANILSLSGFSFFLSSPDNHFGSLVFVCWEIRYLHNFFIYEDPPNDSQTIVNGPHNPLPY